MFNNATTFVVALIAIGISNTANAQYRQQQSATDRGVIVCDERGCSDRPRAVHPGDHSATDRRASASQASAYDAAIGTSNTANAQHRQRQSAADRGVIVCNEHGCSDRLRAVRPGDQRATAGSVSVSQESAYDANGNTVIVGGRPAGCPRQFCGCEASRYVFGKMRPELYLAANWIKYFPRTSPAPGMVAARSGHVMVLISQAEGNDWLVHDGNSGGGLTRRHVRSLRGYVIVDPHGSRSAQGHKSASSVE